jgi:hypothetical protein
MCSLVSKLHGLQCSLSRLNPPLNRNTLRTLRKALVHKGAMFFEMGSGGSLNVTQRAKLQTTVANFCTLVFDSAKIERTALARCILIS